MDQNVLRCVLMLNKVRSGEFEYQRGEIILGDKYMFGHNITVLKSCINSKLQYSVEFMSNLIRDRTVFIRYLGRDGTVFMR